MSIKDLNITVSGMNNLEIKDLFNELKISEKNIGSDISYKFVGENSPSQNSESFGLGLPEVQR